MRLLGRALVGAVAGGLIGLTGTALIGTLLEWIPETGWPGIIVLAIGALIGAGVTVAFGKRDLGHRVRAVVYGMCAGAFLAVVAAEICETYAARAHYPRNYQYPKARDPYVFLAGLVTMPIGLIAGGFVGFWLVRNRSRLQATTNANRTATTQETSDCPQET